MAIPLITNDFLSPPPPPSAVSPTVANLLAMGGQAIAQRAEKNAQVQEARALAPTITQGYASGYSKIANGDFSGFHDMVAASMIGVGNPLLMETAKEAVQAGTTIAHSYMQDKLLQEQLGSRERIASERDATRIAVGAGGGDVAQGRLDLARQREKDRVDKQIADYKIKFKNKSDFEAGLPQDQRQQSPITLDDGTVVPPGTHPDDFEKQQNIQLNQQFPVHQQDQNEPQGDTSLNPPLPVAAPINETDARYATASPSLTRPANSDSEFIRQGSNNAPSAIAPPGTGNNGEAGQVPVTTDQLSQPPQPPQELKPAPSGVSTQPAIVNGKPSISIASDGKQQPSFYVSEIVRSADGKDHYTQKLNPSLLEQDKKTRDAVDTAQESMNALSRTDLWDFMMDANAQGLKVMKKNVPPARGEKIGKDESPPAVFYVNTPQGQKFLNDETGKARVFDSSISTTFDKGDAAMTYLHKSFNVVMPDLDQRKAQLQQAANNQAPNQAQPSGVIPHDQAQRTVANTNETIDMIGQSRYNKIIDAGGTPEEIGKKLEQEYNRVKSIVGDFPSAAQLQANQAEKDKASKQAEAQNTQQELQRTAPIRAKTELPQLTSQLNEMRTQLDYYTKAANHSTGTPEHVAQIQSLAKSTAQKIRDLQDKIDEIKSNL